jgi:hypothetical protein
MLAHLKSCGDSHQYSKADHERVLEKSHHNLLWSLLDPLCQAGNHDTF